MTTQLYKVGVDIGGTNTVIGLVDDSGHCVDQRTFPTNSFPTAAHFTRHLADSIRNLYEEKHGISDQQFCGIGIGAPAALHREGVIRHSANMPWEAFNIVELLQQYFSHPISLVNDSNAAALGELRYGLGRQKNNFLVITIGTGLGAGIVVDGKLLNGEHDTAGELGHMSVGSEGRQCGCKRRGCVETYVSANGLRRTVFDLLADETTNTEMRHINFYNLTADIIHKYAKKQDPIAVKAFAITGNYLGIMLANASAVFDPELIILSGGLMNAGDLILSPAKASFEEHALPSQKKSVAILRSQFPDGEGAILGASSLIPNMSHHETLLEK